MLGVKEEGLSADIAGGTHHLWTSGMHPFCRYSLDPSLVRALTIVV
jgi:hypothetical protein